MEENMKKIMGKTFFKSLLLTLFITASPYKGVQAQSLLSTAGVAVGTSLGAYSGAYAVILYFLEATEGKAANEKIAMLQNDSIEYFASEGEHVTPLLSKAIAVAYENMSAHGIDVSNVSEEYVVRSIHLESSKIIEQY